MKETPLECVSENTHRLEPEAIQIGSALLFGQSNEPPPATFIPLILPHGLDSILFRKKRIKDILQFSLLNLKGIFCALELQG